MIARVLLGAAAVAAMVAFAVWLDSARAEQRAAQVAFAAPAELRARAAGALRDADDSKRLTPDTYANLLRWRVLYFSGRRARAERVLDEVVRREPDNASGWIALANSTEDAARARRARARLRELNPLLSAAGR